MKQLYVVNLALRYKDGDKFKVENDTLFTENLPTEETIKEMVVKYSCDVLCTPLGIMTVFPDEVQKDKALVAFLPKAEVLKDFSPIRPYVEEEGDGDGY
nr:MAG: hypothetical protein [Microvirus sp.]